MRTSHNDSSPYTDLEWALLWSAPGNLQVPEGILVSLRNTVPGRGERQIADWLELLETDALDGLGTRRQGIGEDEAEKRLGIYGEDVLQENGKLQQWQTFLSQFKDLLIIILIATAAVFMLTSDPESAMAILAVLLLNAVLGTVQHQKAEKSSDSLKQLSSPGAKIIREGLLCVISSSAVAPGDILILEIGGLVAADERLLEVRGSTISESPLTGESLSMERHARGVKNQGGAVALTDGANMVFSGSLATSGGAIAVATAMETDMEIGKIAPLMSDTKEQKTPLQVNLNRFSGRLAITIIAICGLALLLSLCRREPVLDVLMLAVVLAVAAIPEALSSIVTIVRVMGTQRVVKEQAIIKNLRAMESLGRVSVIYFDKTGALTQNRVDVERVYINHTEQEVRWLEKNKARTDVKILLYGAMLDNNASTGNSQNKGDPMEMAPLHMARETSMIPEQIRMMSLRRREIPFDPARKLMTTVNEVGDTDLTFVRGAVDVLLKKCIGLTNPASFLPGRRGGAGTGLSSPGGSTPGGPMGAPDPVPPRILSSSDRQRIINQNGSRSPKSLQILALACHPYQSAKKNGEEEELIFLGLVAMVDPLRPESRSVVTSARQARVRPVTITRDHKVIAMAIAERIGILNPGDMAAMRVKLDQIGDEDLSRRLEHIFMYIRASPGRRVHIINAWQERGHIVAMTGDGVNDVPALKKADIDVIMGITGTRISKGAVFVILMDDNFTTIIKVVTNGRNVYHSIKNAIQSLLSDDMVGILRVPYTSLLALPLPPAPVHLLSINLIMDSLPAIAIDMEPPEEGLLKEPPRDPEEGILTMSFIRDILVQGGLIATAAIWVCTTGLHEGGPGRACTMAFSTLTPARLLHRFNCRNARSIIRLGLGSNLYSVMVLQPKVTLLAAVLSMPGPQIMFVAADLGLSQLSTIVTAVSLPTLTTQTYKTLKKSIS